MAKAERVRLIKEIEKHRESRVISYITSTRPGLEVQMAMDSIRRIYEHLTSERENCKKIDLFIHSNGGDGIVPWRLVTLIREFCEKFAVIVPHRAFSAATLTALGADEVVMHGMGMLGPTDPTVVNPFNPQDPANPSQKLGISVEDVTAYLALIKEDAGITHDDELVLAFNKLADQVHPLALGNVKRSLSQSRMMARKLLGLHMDAAQEAHKIKEIVDNLTSKLFYHGHPINRAEAKNQLGLPTIQNPDPEVEDLIWKLYLDYELEMKLDEPFNIALELLKTLPNPAAGQVVLTSPAVAKVVYVESASRTDVHRLEYRISGQKQPNGATNATLIIEKQGWTTE